MPEFGPPLTPSATRLVLLGSGELGREVAIEAMRLGCEVVAVDRYPGAPAMQVAHRFHTCQMSDPDRLRIVLEQERAIPHARLIVVPELEAIATPVLEELEADGLHVVPTARAARLTMDREGIRRLAAEELGLPTSPYRFCDSEEEVVAAVAELGVPCVVKPVMSSSGKGQSVVRDLDGGPAAWAYAQRGGRVGEGRVIVRGLRRLRLRDHPPHRASRRRHDLLRPDRARPGGRRLPRELAAAPHEAPPRSRAPRTSRTASPRRSAAPASSASSCSSAATRCCSAKSPRARTTPAW